MTLYATVQVKSPALATSVEHAPDVDVSLEQRTMTPDGSLDVTLRGRGSSLDAFEDGLDADGTVSRWVPVGGTDTWRLYRARLTERASSSMDFDGWTGGRAVFPSVERTKRGLTVEAFMPDRRVLQQFGANCTSNGVRFELQRVSEDAQLGEGEQFGLTDLQAETLLEAHDRGYYTVPREANLEEVAAPLDVSHQALSERLRRGVGSLIEHTIADQWIPDDGPGTSDPDLETGSNVHSERVPIDRSTALSL